jgi:hypothetical protein
MSSSDSNARADLWAEHYRAASERRRARGWHRREPKGDGQTARYERRWRRYAALAVALVALTIVGLLIPR